MDVEYLFQKDKSHGKDGIYILLCYNGLDYYAATFPKKLGKATKNSTLARSYLTDAINLLETVMSELPASSCHDAYAKAVRSAKTCFDQADITVGTALEHDEAHLN